MRTIAVIDFFSLGMERIGSTRSEGGAKVDKRACFRFAVGRVAPVACWTGRINTGRPLKLFDLFKTGVKIVVKVYSACVGLLMQRVAAARFFYKRL